ncbi:MAG: NAD(P)/FAD-dependent oxidoreductase [Planctomycetota bacterium]
MTALGDDGPVVIVGAGLAGTVLALYLARRGVDVELYESRPDLRRAEFDGNRSINLALATRGKVALEEVGVLDQVADIVIPMAGRIVHADGEVTTQPYGNDGQVIDSVSRSDLNAILLDAAEATGRIAVHFDRHLQALDLDRRTATFSPYREPTAATTVPFGNVLAVDGATSSARPLILAANGGTATVEPLEHGYKELEIPPAVDGGFRLEEGGLHIWPRGELMLIALANPEGDFTATLFMPHRGAPDRGARDGFDAVDDPEAVTAFFERHFPDVIGLIGAEELQRQWRTNPVGDLATVRVDRWALDERAVLVGDAAHAIVPFHGQGMNAGMESCRLLDRAIAAHPDDTATAFATFAAGRRPDADAIADMAIDNYVEMRSDVMDPDYLLRRDLALALEERFPDRIAARYGMVTFTTMPYAEVVARNERQQEVFRTLIDTATDLDDVDWARAERLVDDLGPLPSWI